ncbi:MAG: hypothetical protein WBS19_20745 [Candidatus Korobacteraceae bacterium]
MSQEAVKTQPLALRLEDWIDENVFGLAKQEGWFNAISYYAIRDPRYQRAEVYWSECTKTWKNAKPTNYPTIAEWKAIAAQCDETAHLTASERKARASSRLVPPDLLSDAVESYVDWEAFAYWAQPALERGSRLPAEVAGVLKRRCPGFLEPITRSRFRANVTSEPYSEHSAWVE